MNSSLFGGRGCLKELLFSDAKEPVSSCVLSVCEMLVAFLVSLMVPLLSLSLCCRSKWSQSISHSRCVYLATVARSEEAEKEKGEQKRFHRHCFSSSNSGFAVEMQSAL